MKALLLGALGALVSAPAHARPQQVGKYGDLIVRQVSPKNCMTKGPAWDWSIRIDTPNNELTVMLRSESLKPADWAWLMNAAMLDENKPPANPREVTVVLDDVTETWHMVAARLPQGPYLVMGPKGNPASAFNRMIRAKQIEFKYTLRATALGEGRSLSLLQLTNDDNLSKALKHTYGCAVGDPSHY